MSVYVAHTGSVLSKKFDISTYVSTEERNSLARKYYLISYISGQMRIDLVFGLSPNQCDICIDHLSLGGS